MNTYQTLGPFFGLEVVLHIRSSLCLQGAYNLMGVSGRNTDCQ